MMRYRRAIPMCPPLTDDMGPRDRAHMKGLGSRASKNGTSIGRPLMGPAEKGDWGDEGREMVAAYEKLTLVWTHATGQWGSFFPSPRAVFFLTHLLGETSPSFACAACPTGVRCHHFPAIIARAYRNLTSTSCRNDPPPPPPPASPHRAAVASGLSRDRVPGIMEA